MLNAILAPAMAIMGRLRFAYKLGLIGLLFLTPLAATVYWLNQKITDDISFAEAERIGVEDIIPARLALEAIIEYRGVSQLAAAGGARSKERLASLAGGIDQKLASLGKVAEKAEPALGIQDGFSSVERLWRELRSMQYSAQETLDKQNKLAASLIDYIATVSDKSNLTLDPDIDSYYTMDTVVFRIPVVADYGSRLQALGGKILQQGTISTVDKIALATLRTVHGRESDAIQSDITKAIAVNSALTAALAAKFQEARDAGASLQNESANLLADNLATSAQDYLGFGAAANGKLYRFFDATIEELDKLLLARIHRFKTNLNVMLGATGAVLLAVLYLFAGMLASVLRSLNAIEAGAERLAEGDVSKTVDGHSSDELCEVARAVNSVAQTLHKFTEAQIGMARAHSGEGRCSEEMRASEFPGVYGEMARNINEMVKSHVDVQMQFVDLMRDYTSAKFDRRMEQLPGERRRISDTAETIREELEAAHKAQFNALIKAALDCVDAAVGVADKDANIVYLNPPFMEILRKNEAGIRQKIPGFDAEKAVGASAGLLFADPAATVALMRTLTKPHESHQTLGSRVFQVVDSPVFDDKGERLGVTGRWTDVTEQLAAEKQLAALVEAAAAGDFKKRIEEAGKTGFMLQMAQGLNAILDTSEQALGEISRMLKALAEGDLNKTIGGDFKGVFAELKGDSDATVERLREIIARIGEASQAINMAAREITTGHNDLSRRTEEQASSLEKTASSLEQFTSTVRHNAENASEARKLAIEASGSAERGGELVAKVVDTMNGITDSNREIADITTLIDGIAFQTNLLALNAAVEAARAGEQGRGFAVVSSEVRILAQRAADAAKDIKAVIQNSVGKVGEGATLVAAAGAAMEEIVQRVGGVSAIIGEIAAASNDQSESIAQVNQAVTSIDRSTQQNASLVEEATAAAKNLEHETGKLLQAVAVFRVAEEKGGARRPGVGGARTLLH